MRAPYALFFPLGALLGVVGVSHWLLYGRGLLASYNGQAHALIQIEGFLMAFASGFLGTMLPRHFGGPPPSRWLVGAITICLVAGVIGSLGSAWIVAELAFALALAALLVFSASQLGSRMLRTPFLLLGAGLAFGIVGDLGLLAGDYWGVPVDLSRALIQEGLFVGIVLGLGHFLFPLLMGDPERPRAGIGIALLCLLLLIGSFAAQGWLIWRSEPLLATRFGQGLRAAAVLIFLLFGLRAIGPPRAPGNHRVWIWLAFWMMPIGPLAAALFPAHRIALLHILFVGCFSLLAFAIGHHVLHAHGGRVQELLRKSQRVRVFGALFVFAMITRVSSDLMPESYWIHIEGAAGAWLLALLIWLWAVARPLGIAWRTSCTPE